MVAKKVGVLINIVGIATGYDLGDRCSIPGRGRNFSLLHSVQTGSGAHPASSPMDTSGVKWAVREADHTPPSSAEVNNGGVIPPLPIRLKHGDNFIFLPF
jgi:hypothetical protein